MDPQRVDLHVLEIFWHGNDLTPSGSKAGNAAQPAGSNPKATMRRKGNACRHGGNPSWILTHEMVFPGKPFARKLPAPQKRCENFTSHQWNFTYSYKVIYKGPKNSWFPGPILQRRHPGGDEPMASWLGYRYIQATSRTRISRKNGKHLYVNL